MSKTKNPSIVFASLAKELLDGSMEREILANERYKIIQPASTLVDRSAFDEVLLHIGKVILSHHNIVIDSATLPSAEGQGFSRIPFPVTSFYYSDLITDGTGGSPILAEYITVLAESYDETGIRAYPFIRLGGIQKWIPTMLMMDVSYDCSKEYTLYAFPGFDLSTEADKDLHVGELLIPQLVMVRDALQLINCANVELQEHPVSATRKMITKNKKKGLELTTYSTILLPSRPRSQEEGRGGHHASPALHHRRGHYRRIHKGTEKQRQVYVHPCLVGLPENGITKSTYTIR